MNERANERNEQLLTNKKQKVMKKFVIYTMESEKETGTFTEEQLNDEFGFDEMDVKEIQALGILESTVLSMSMSVIILRVWDI